MYRFMRIVVMYDLPMLTSSERRSYRTFNKQLVLAGFIRLQYSVYTKLVLNRTQQLRYERLVERHKPPTGSLIMFTVTERQYANRTFLLGSEYSDVLQSDERLVIW